MGATATGGWKVLYSTREAAEALGLSRSTVYTLMAAGVLQWCSYGTKRLVTAESLQEFAQELRDGTAKVPA